MTGVYKYYFVIILFYHTLTVPTCTNATELSESVNQKPYFYNSIKTQNHGERKKPAGMAFVGGCGRIGGRPGWMAQSSGRT